MSEWRVWKSTSLGWWWATKKSCTDADDPRCVCYSFTTWADAMSYVKGYVGAEA